MDRSSFDCGKSSLNDWIKTQASQFVKRDQTRIHCVLFPNTNRIAGYYALSTHAVEPLSIPAPDVAGLPKRLSVPAILIGQLAVDVRARGIGLGEYLLFDAIRRIVQVYRIVGIRLIVVHAVDDTARAFYERYGFASLVDDKLHLYYSVKKASQEF